jgi:Kdo2-lipid IVA lauroyltransferase/acyltransferase
MQTAPRHVARWAKNILNFILGGLAILSLKALRRTKPVWAVDIGGRLMRRLGPWLPEHRLGRANLAAAFPQWSATEIERVLGGVWDNLGRLGAEFIHLDHLWTPESLQGDRSRIELSADTEERFLRLRDDGKPALLFAAHLANWELPALGAATYGLDTAILFRPPNIASVSRLVLDIRSSRMGKLIPTTIGAPIKLADALERGEHVGMLVDQYYSRGVEVTFFGRRTKANPLIARLARRIDCPIHGTRVIRLPGNRFRVDLTEAIRPARDANGEVDITATMQIITGIIEGWIREHPEQWLWLHRRWR